MLKLLLPTLLMLTVNSVHAQAKYSVTNLGLIGIAGERDGAIAINDHGQVVGGARGHAFLWTNSKRRDLGTLPAPTFEDSTLSVANGLNSQGVVVGCSGSFSAAFTTGLEFARGFAVRDGRMRQFGSGNVSFIPYAINDAGQIAGLNSFRGFCYTNGEMFSIGTFSQVPNGNRSTARGINAFGQVTGWSTIEVSPKAEPGMLMTHAFLWQRGKPAQMRDLGTLPGWVNSYAYAINNRAEVVGSLGDAISGTYGVNQNSHAVAFLWHSGKMVSLGTLPGSKSSEAFGINNHTEVVGRSDKRAFLWTSGRMIDLNSRLPAGSGWTLEEARAINNRGQIVGTGKLGGQIHMFLLTPKPGV